MVANETIVQVDAVPDYIAYIITPVVLKYFNPKEDSV